MIFPVYEKGVCLSAGLSAADSTIAFKLNRVGLESASYNRWQAVISVLITGEVFQPSLRPGLSAGFSQTLMPRLLVPFS